MLIGDAVRRAGLGSSIVRGDLPSVLLAECDSLRTLHMDLQQNFRLVTLDIFKANPLLRGESSVIP